MQNNPEFQLQIVDKYLIFRNEKVGQGQFGAVYKGAYVPGQGSEDILLAVKLVELPYNSHNDDKMRILLNNLKSEIKTLRAVKHKNIVRYYDVKKEKNKIYIITEYCNNGNLNNFIMSNNLSETEILYYFSQILEGFKHMRQKNIIHRDVKPDNILLNKGIIKVADFGFAKATTQDQMLETYMGTPVTMSPQILMGEKYTDKSDIYSLGVVLYFMFNKEYPFKNLKMMERAKVFEKQQKIKFKKGVEISENIKKLIQHMMAVKESDRIDWAELFDHPDIKQAKYKYKFELNNIDDYDDYEEQNNKLQDGRVLQDDFDYDPKDYQDINKEELAEKGKKIIDELNNKLKQDKLAKQITNRVMFQKGIALLVGRVQRLFQNFIDNSQSISQIVHEEFLIILKYSFTKYEFYLLKNLRDTLENDIRENFHMTDHDIETIRENYEFKKIKKFLEMDIKKTEIKIIQDDKNKIQNMKNRAEYYPLKFQKMIEQNNIFDQDIKDLQIFLNLLKNLVLDFISYFDQILTKVKLNDMSSINNPEIKKLLFLIDEMMIIINHQSIFVWSEVTNFNFNKFLELRNQITEQNSSYRFLIERVLLTFTYFVKNQN